VSRSKPRLRAPLVALLLALAAALPPAPGPVGAVDPPQPSPQGEIFKPHASVPVVVPSAPGVAPKPLAGAVVPSGFRDELLIGGLDSPTVVQFAADGRIIVGEKSGRIKIYSSPTDTSPGVYTGLMTNVYDMWDRGFLGMVIDPNFSTGRPFLYVSYTYNHILLDPAPAPKWPGDGCADPPGITTDGCVASGRIDRLTIDGKNVDTTPGASRILVEDWCQQFPSHSMGSLAFGPEGALYATGGEGASFTTTDWGQLGGTRTTPSGQIVTPANPCDDPNTSKGTPTTRPQAEGGSLRAQDLRTPTTDPVGLNGTLIRVDPNSGVAYTGNSHYSSTDPNERRVVAYGFRNPFRFAIRPGTNEVWIGDVGNYSWEEINEIPSANGPRRNFGWPCYEGDARNTEWDGIPASTKVDICEQLNLENPNPSAPTTVTRPAFKYPHSDPIAGESCDLTRGSAIAGLAFLGTTSSYPNEYDKALFFTDYNRRCIWWIEANPTSGRPDFTQLQLFANLDRTDPDPDGGAVYLGTDRIGDLVYADFDRGEIRRIRWYSSVPPTASFTATPTSGPNPLQVTFDASGSTNPNPTQALQYAWDLDGDGSFDDGTTNPITKIYTGAKATVVVGLKVTSSTPLSDTATRTIWPGYVAPTVTMSQPPSSLQWHPNDVIPFSATATDGNGAQLPASAFSWSANIEHCPAACHSHPAFYVNSGVKAGSFPAPDHEYPSRIRIKLTVTDGPVATTVIREIAMAPPPVDDGSNTCAGAPAPAAPDGIWTAGRFGSTGDVDWFRFSLSKATRVRIVLGDLAVNGKLELYRGCTTLLLSSDRSGTTLEEVYPSLAAGTYAIKLSGSGTPSTPPYIRLIRAMPATAHVMSYRTQVSGSSLILVGEVFNNTTSTRGPIIVTARMYNASGGLLGTRTSTALPTLLPATRTPFRIVGSVPAGFHHVSYSVSAPVSSARVVRPSVTSIAQGPDAAHRWNVSGTVRNGSSPVRYLRVDIAAYDNRGVIVDTVRAGVGATSLAANAATMFSGTFPTAGYIPTRTAVWTYALR
jgi:glucose/arabinose dehydrogenase